MKYPINAVQKISCFTKHKIRKYRVIISFTKEKLLIVKQSERRMIPPYCVIDRSILKFYSANYTHSSPRLNSFLSTQLFMAEINNLIINSVV